MAHLQVTGVAVPWQSLAAVWRQSPVACVPRHCLACHLPGRWLAADLSLHSPAVRGPLGEMKASILETHQEFCEFFFSNHMVWF